MKIVINSLCAGLNLSLAAALHYAKLCGFELFPVVEVKNKYVPYEDGMNCPYGPIYLTKPLTAEGEFQEGAFFHLGYIKRNDPHLVATIEQMGDQASRQGSLLKVVVIPEGVDWAVREHDEKERVEEKQRVWG